MLIWGWQRRIHHLVFLTLVCAYCHNPSAHALRKTVTKFTLFFIPLFEVRSKHSLQCTYCGGLSEVPAAHVNDLLGRAQHEAVQTGGFRQGQPNPAAPNGSWPQQ